MYYDLLARIKNAAGTKRETIQAPFSQFDFAVAKVLADTGYITSAEKKSVGKRTVLELRLKYENGRSALSDFRLWSKPSRRMYKGYRDLRPIRQGKGVAVISTPAGVVSSRDARKKKLGGEYLFEVW